MTIIEKAIQTGRSLSLYDDCEQADQEKEEQVFDYLWQSLYDVYKLAHFGIIEDVDKTELEATVDWLCKYQAYTDKYKDVSIPF